MIDDELLTDLFHGIFLLPQILYDVVIIFDPGNGLQMLPLDVLLNDAFVAVAVACACNLGKKLTYLNKLIEDPLFIPTREKGGSGFSRHISSVDDVRH